LTVTATSSTTASLKWTAVSGAQGYNIYWKSGGGVYFLGKVGAGTTHAQIVNLPPGSTSQFLVQAYRGTAVGNSAWVSVTTPLARHADPVAVLAGLSGHGNHSKQDDFLWQV
jgi:hypothetical protein